MFPALWMEYAREFLGETNHVERKQTILFNRWNIDSAYRGQIAAKLRLSDSKRPRPVSKWGEASSFGNPLGDLLADRTKLEKRWTQFRD